MKLLDNAIEYVYGLTDTRIFPKELPLEKQDLLPVFISRNYFVNSVSILGKEYVLLVHQHGEKPTPAQAVTYMNKVEDNLQAQAVFVFPQLEAFVRNRLISKRVPFIVPFQHLYLPQGLIDIREQSSKVAFRDRVMLSISDPAQVMLLYYISNKEKVDKWPLRKWSEKLDYSSMSISRAWKELAAIELCEGQKKGRNLILDFTGSTRELWERALPYLHTPVRHRKIAIVDTINNLHLRRAGVTALADYSLISKDARPEFAIKLSDWNAAKKQSIVNEVSPANDLGVVIETWSYDPKIIAPGSENVDALSLYLSLQDAPDERIQGALKEMLGGLPW